jgi:hypothetical protein
MVSVARAWPTSFTPGRRARRSCKVSARSDHPNHGGNRGDVGAVAGPLAGAAPTSIFVDDGEDRAVVTDEGTRPPAVREAHPDAAGGEQLASSEHRRLGFDHCFAHASIVRDPQDGKVLPAPAAAPKLQRSTTEGEHPEGDVESVRHVREDHHSDRVSGESGRGPHVCPRTRAGEPRRRFDENHPKLPRGGTLEPRDVAVRARTPRVRGCL